MCLVTSKEMWARFLPGRSVAELLWQRQRKFR